MCQFILIIAVGVLRASPFNYFTAAATGAGISDHMLMPVAMAVLRVFVLLELKPFRIHSHAPQIPTGRATASGPYTDSNLAWISFAFSPLSMKKRATAYYFIGFHNVHAYL
jgi:hypothetical protein